MTSGKALQSCTVTIYDLCSVLAWFRPQIHNILQRKHSFHFEQASPSQNQSGSGTQPLLALHSPSDRNTGWLMEGLPGWHKPATPKTSTSLFSLSLGLNHSSYSITPPQLRRGPLGMVTLERRRRKSLSPQQTSLFTLSAMFLVWIHLCQLRPAAPALPLPV